MLGETIEQIHCAEIGASRGEVNNNNFVIAIPEYSCVSKPGTSLL
jgi:hypothetical protein